MELKRSDDQAAPEVADGIGAVTSGRYFLARPQDLARYYGSRARLAVREPEWIALAAIVVIGLLLRYWLFRQWRPGFIGFPDSGVYLDEAQKGIFDDPLRVGGYALFLQFFHDIRPHLSFAIFIQHLMGVASGLLLFGAMRRGGAPRGLGLVPAAVVLLNGSELFIEHAVLTEATFIFLISVCLYCIVRAWRGSWAWAAPAGAALGMAVIVRTVGLALTPVLVLLFVAVAAVPWRDRLLRLAVLVVLSAVPVTWYLIAHKHDTGYGGFTATGYMDLYGRVGPFADCSKFKPPAATDRLCIHIPRSQRDGADFWEFNGGSPAVQVFGAPEFGPAPPLDENTKLRRFAVAAIEGQPFDYLEFVGRDLLRIVDPSYSSSPYGIRTAYGPGPQNLIDYYFDPFWNTNNTRFISAYYPTDGTIHRSLSSLKRYERDTRIEGPVMAILLLLAVVAPFITSRPVRRLAILFGVTTLVLLAAPVFLSHYEYRFVIPAFGPLAATSALGGWALYVKGGPLRMRARGWLQRRLAAAR